MSMRVILLMGYFRGGVPCQIKCLGMWESLKRDISMGRDKRFFI